MRALVVGAGSVGQVYGYHLANGGVEVGFLVKPKHLAEVGAGFTLYPLERAARRRDAVERFTDFGAFASIAEAAREPWDQVYLTISSTALRHGRWFGDLAEAVGQATIVLLQPGPEDRKFVLHYMEEERLIQGIIMLVAYPAPLPGETRFSSPGTAYWTPPLITSPMDGTPDRLAPVVAALRSGGLPARPVREVNERAAFGAAFLLPIVGALEQAGWRFDRMVARDPMKLALRASRQAVDVVAHHSGLRPPFTVRLAARPLVVRTLLGLANFLTPFDLESYLGVHFTKVRDQTHDALQTYRAWGEEAGLATDALDALSR